MFVLIKRLYLIGVWLGEDQRTNTLETHVLKRLDYGFHTLLTIPHTIVNTIWKDLCIQLRNQQPYTSKNYNYFRESPNFNPSFVDASLLIC